MTPEAGRVVAGRFRLIGELGNGNMGSVWLADHLGLGVRCAVKLMAHAALRDTSSRARFQLEAMAIARLQSPHIVRVLDYAVDEDTPFIAMELLQGEELAARLGRVGRLDAATTYALVAQIARGLSKAHAVGIVHRDLKPENIFLTDTDEGEIAKILDFGIAKVMAPGAGCGTLSGTVLGTPQYMSPEQVRGAATIDHRSDLWSLAVITYECLLGRLPFESPTLGDVFAQIVADPIPVPSRMAPPGVRLPRGFDAWWARAVSRDVHRRFGSTQELVDALRRVIEDEGLDPAGSAADITTPPIAIAPVAAEDEPVEPPMRSPWRSRALVVAAAMGIVAVATLGHLRSVRGTAAGSTGSTAVVVAAPAAVPAAREGLAPQTGSEAASVATAPPVALAPLESTTSRPGDATRAGSARSPHSHRAPLPVTKAVARTPNAPPSPTARTPASSGPPVPVAAPPPRPTDDVDFGI